MTRILLAIFCFVILTGSALPAMGQASPDRDPAAVVDQIKTLTEQLNLTTEQKTQVDTVFKKADDDLQSAKGELQNASTEDKTARFRQILGDLRQQIGELLTPDQKADLQQKLQALRGSTTAPAASDGSSAASPPPRNQRFGGGPGPNGARPGGPGRGMQYLQRLKSALDQVGLSPDQQTQVDQFLADTKQQILTLRAGIQNGSVDRDSIREKIRSVLDNSRTKLGGILTPDQLTKLREAMSQNADAPPERPARANFGSSPVSGNSPVAPQIRAKAPTTAPVQPAVSSIQVPAVGQAAPDFSLKTLNGQTADLASYNHKLLVLVLGSYTNPSFRDRAAGLEALRDQYGGRGVSFLIIYTRETHPTGGWEVQRNKTDNIDIPQPTNQTQRDSIADRAKAAMNLSIAVAPDTMDDKIDTAYAVGDGTPAYLIGRDGKILFRQSWLEPMALEQAIQDALK